MWLFIYPCTKFALVHKSVLFSDSRLATAAEFCFAEVTDELLIKSAEDMMELAAKVVSLLDELRAQARCSFSS